MKRFLSRFAVFASIAGILLAMWSAAVMWAEFSTYRHELRMPTGTHVLVCGDSQVAHALDPMLWPDLFNFSLDATLLDQSRMKLADLLAANPGRIDTVLFDISPWKFYVNNPRNALIEEGAAAQQLLLHLLHWRENIRPLNGFAKMFRDLVLVKKGRKLHRLVAKRRPYRSSLCGGYVRTCKAAFIDAPDFAEHNIRRISGGHQRRAEGRDRDRCVRRVDQKPGPCSRGGREEGCDNHNSISSAPSCCHRQTTA